MLGKKTSKQTLKKSGIPKRNISLKTWLIVILASLGTSWALPPASLEPLAWVTLSPIIYLCYKQTHWKNAFAIGLVYGALVMWITASWLLNVTTIGWMACAWLAIFPATFGAIICNNNTDMKSNPRWYLPLWWSCVWIFLEGIRNVMSPFGWNPTAAMTENINILQNARYGGQWIIGFLILLSNSTIAFCLIKSKQEYRKDKLIIILICLTLACTMFLWGKHRIENTQTQRYITVALMSSYFPFTRDLEKRWEALEKLIKWTKNLDSKYLNIWQESISFVVLGHQAVWDKIKTMTETVEGPILITSTYPCGEKIYNTSLLLENQGTQAQMYIKRDLTPFGEYIPPIFPKSWRVGKRDPGDYSEDSTLLVEDGNEKKYRIGMLVCLEETISKAAHKRVKDGAEILVSPSNHGDTGVKCAKQQAAMGKLRAIETGKTIIRCDNFGGSNIYDGLGQEIANKLTLEEGIKEVKVPVLDIKGDYFEHYQRLTYWLISIGFLIGLNFKYKYLTKIAFKPILNREEPKQY